VEVVVEDVRLVAPLLPHHARQLQFVLRLQFVHLPHHNLRVGVEVDLEVAVMRKFQLVVQDILSLDLSKAIVEVDIREAVEEDMQLVEEVTVLLKQDQVTRLDQVIHPDQSQVQVIHLLQSLFLKLHTLLQFNNKVIAPQFNKVTVRLLPFNNKVTVPQFNKVIVRLLPFNNKVIVLLNLLPQLLMQVVVVAALLTNPLLQQLVPPKLLSLNKTATAKN